MTETVPAQRVPNVRAGAVSGFGDELLAPGGPTHPSYAPDSHTPPAPPVGDPAVPVIPEAAVTVVDLMGWIAAAADEAEERARAVVVLAAEYERVPEERRVTLLEPLESYLHGDDPTEE